MLIVIMLLVQIRAMQAGAAAHLHSQLTPKRGSRQVVYIVTATMIA